ncbi:MAG: TolC family protein [Pontiellaceae bacterium]|nr:TolC family protein [Pontiellaceae bacterium]
MKARGTKLWRGPGAKVAALGVLCLGILLPTADGAENAESNLTLQAALKYAEADHPKIEAAYQRWKGAEENITVQKALPDPMLSYGLYVEPIETRVGPQKQRFGVSQMFPAFGKLSAKQAIAEDAADAEEQRYQSEKLQIRSAVARAYAELYFLERSIRITQDRISLITDLEEVARTRYSAGEPLNATLQAQLELGRLEDNLNTLIDRRHPQKAKLNALLNRPAEAALTIDASLPYRVLETAPNTPIANPELMELKARIHQGNHQVQLAQKERLPDITLGVTYIDTGSASMPVADSGQDVVITSIGLSLPIWNGKNRARIEAAAHQKAASQMMLTDRTLALEAEIQQQLFDLRDAERKIDLYKKSLIPKAEQALAVNRQSYEAGQVEFINLIDNERMLLEFELAYERALADHLIARAELSRLTGTDLLKGATDETD